MNEWLAAHSSLPNLHPALVHFPIALVPVAALLDLAAASWQREREWLARAGTLVWVLATAAAGLAFWAGERAADSLHGVEPHVLAHVGEHSDWALYTLWTVGLLAAARLAVARWRPRQPGLLAVAALLGLGAMALVVRTADLGGGLVFEHGVAVAAESAAEHGEEAVHGETHTGSAEGDGHATGGEQATAAASREAVLSRLQHGDDGGLEWHPRAGDGAALGSVLEALSGGDAVHAASAQGTGDAGGLPLDVDGRSLLVLPGTYSDVEVDAELDLADFAGTVGLAHHAAAGGRTGLLSVETPAGELALERVQTPAGDTPASGDGPEVLESGHRDLHGGGSHEPLRLGVYAAGRHLRGLLDGETVLHAHAAALPAGRAGLLLDGHGKVVVRSLSVTPVEHH